LKLLGDEAFEDLCEGVLCADLLVARGLVDEGDDSDASEPANQDLGLLRDVCLVSRKVARLSGG
jgi:hypothetical protein